jgi:cysteine desulfurase/selenocysteine lyase
VGLENIARHEHDLLVYGTAALCEIPGLCIVGTAKEKAGVLSFFVDGHDTHAMSQALDKEGIAVRGGNHCAQPILRRMGRETTVRASLAPYNTHEDIDALVAAVRKIVGAR